MGKAWRVVLDAGGDQQRAWGLGSVWGDINQVKGAVFTLVDDKGPDFSCAFRGYIDTELFSEYIVSLFSEEGLIMGREDSDSCVAVGGFESDSEGLGSSGDIEVQFAPCASDEGHWAVFARGYCVADAAEVDSACGPMGGFYDEGHESGFFGGEGHMLRFACEFQVVVFVPSVIDGYGLGHSGWHCLFIERVSVGVFESENGLMVSDESGCGFQMYGVVFRDPEP